MNLNFSIKLRKHTHGQRIKESLHMALVKHFGSVNDHFWSLRDHHWKSLFWLLDQSAGVQNAQLGQAEKMGGNKKKHFQRAKFCRKKGTFFDFFENFQNGRFWAANFSVTTGTENARKLSSQIFYCGPRPKSIGPQSVHFKNKKSPTKICNIGAY